MIKQVHLPVAVLLLSTTVTLISLDNGLLRFSVSFIVVTFSGTL